MEEKIKSLEELSDIVSTLKSQSKKIVHCHGVFDLVHFGHIQHFLAAKQQGDVLIVTITPDRFIQKGPGRPFFNQEIRLKHLASIQYIDFVALNQWPTAVETIKLLKPNIYAKGKEVLDNKDVDKLDFHHIKPISNLQAEIEALKSIGGEIYLTDEITFSSSRIINQITTSMPEESKNFLQDFKNNFGIEQILETIESLKNINVLVIGDSMLDEYIYSESMEKSAKEPIVSYTFGSSEIYLGGAFAVANHLSNFVDNICLVTCSGKTHQDLIDSSLGKNIEKKIFIQDFPTMIRKTYLDNYNHSKIFEIYNTEEFKITSDSEQKILNYLQNNIQNFDMILILDFGHGMLSPNILDYLYKSNKFIAINCQLTAGNMGYNFITKYRRADFVSLDERELRLPFQNKTSNIEVSITRLSHHLNLDKINITLGKRGSIYYERGNYFCAPSFTKDPVDTMGAGEAVFSITSLLAYKNSYPHLLPFLGNSVGALAVKITGNQKPIEKSELKKFVAYILK